MYNKAGEVFQVYSCCDDKKAIIKYRKGSHVVAVLDEESVNDLVSLLNDWSFRATNHKEE